MKIPKTAIKEIKKILQEESNMFFEKEVKKDTYIKGQVYERIINNKK